MQGLDGAASAFGLHTPPVTPAHTRRYAVATPSRFAPLDPLTPPDSTLRTPSRPFDPAPGSGSPTRRGKSVRSVGLQLDALSLVPDEPILARPVDPRAPPTRYVRVSGLPRNIEPIRLVEYFCVRRPALTTLTAQTPRFGSPPARTAYVKLLASHGLVVLSFHDLRHAVAAHALVNQAGASAPSGSSSLAAAYLPRADLAAASRKGSRSSALSSSEGEVLLQVHGDRPLDSASLSFLIDGVNVENASVDAAVSFDVRRTQTLVVGRLFSIEFWDDRAARPTVDRLDGAETLSHRLAVSLRDQESAPTPELPAVFSPVKRPALPLPSPSPAVSRTATALTAPAAELASFPNPFRPVLPPAPIATSPTALPIDPTRRSTPAVPKPPGLAQTDRAPEAFDIDLDAIERGDETRTTVMLKNLPNRLTRSEVAAILRETVSTAFDFLYVRVDFASEANLGYAFVNFTSPAEVVKFARARLDTPWDPANSSKHVILSWASIQGRDALVERFRNSTVMEMPSEFRPCLYSTVTGLPEPFPKPNDIKRKLQSQLHREVGLYRKSP